MGSLRNWRVLLVAILAVLMAVPLAAEAAPRPHRKATPRHVVRTHHAGPSWSARHRAKRPKVHHHHHAAPAKKPSKWRHKHR